MVGYQPDRSPAGPQPADRPARAGIYSQDELYQSQRNLYSSDLFRFATVNIDSAKFQPDADSVPMLVQVSEAKRRRVRGGLGYGTDDCFRGSLGWTTRNFLGSGGRILDLTSRISKVGVGPAVRLGPGPEHLRQLQRGLGRLGQGELQPRRVDPAAGVPLAPTTPSRSRSSPSGARSSRSTCGRRPAPRSPSGARRPGGGSRCRWPTPSPTATPRPRPRASARRSTPARRIWWRCCGRTGCWPRSPRRARAAGEQPARPLARLAVLARAHLELALPRLELVPAVLPHGGGTTPGTGRSAGTWCSAGGCGAARSSRPRWTSPPRAATSSRPSSASTPAARTTCAASTGTSWGRGLRRAQGRGGHGRHQGPAIDPNRVTVAATGGNTLAVGNVELRVPSPVFSSRLRLAAFVDAGGVWQRGSENSTPVIRVTPGVGRPAHHAARSRAARRGLQPVQAAGGPALPGGHPGRAHAGRQDSYVLNRGGKFTFHFAVGQAF